MSDLISLYTIDGFESKSETKSLYKVIKDNPKDRIEVEIGDSKDPSTFHPQAKIMRWDNEVNLSVRYKDSDTSQLVADTKEDVVEWVKSDKEVHIYEKPEVDEDGGLEIEVVLKEKPVSNVIEFSIETKGLDFFYQPELTKEEIDEGVDRPENVVGSYAVYHKEKHGNYPDIEYKTGKFCHIYRPLITDANGNTVWGELNINEKDKLLTVTIGHGFLDKAIYPVIIDPTFGYTSAGSFYTTNLTKNRTLGAKYGSSVSVNGSVDSVTVYIDTNWGTCFFKPFITDSSYSILSNGVGNSNSFAYVEGAGPSWRTVTYTTKPSVSSGNSYYPWIIVNTSYFAWIFADSGSSGGAADTTNSYTNPTDPTDCTNIDYKFSIYATYTEAAADTHPTLQSSYPLPPSGRV